MVSAVYGNLHLLMTPYKTYNYHILNTATFLTVCLTCLQYPTSFQVALEIPSVVTNLDKCSELFLASLIQKGL